MTAYLSDLLEIAPAFLVTRAVYLCDRLIAVASVLADVLVWIARLWWLVAALAAIDWTDTLEMSAEADKEIEL